MKAIIKVYSYKWFAKNAQFDKEVGDGSIIYSLTGLIPEHVCINNFDENGMDLFRRVLSDDYYFNKKAFVQCYSENDWKPRLPS